MNAITTNASAPTGRPWLRRNGLIVALLVTFSISLSIGYSVLQYYTRNNLGWNQDSLEYLDHYYNKPVRGIVRYRVLTIWLAQHVPDLPAKLFSDVRGDNLDWQAQLKFLIVNVLSLTATGVMLYSFQVYLGLQPLTALLGAVLFLTARPIVQSGTIPMVDALSFLFWLWVAWAILANNLWLLVAGYLMGLLTKETTMLTLVFIPLTTLSWRQKGIQAALLGVITVAYIPLRSTLFPGAASSYAFNLERVTGVFDVIKQYVSLRGLFDFFTSFGFIWFLFAYALLQRLVFPKIRFWLLFIPVLLIAMALLSANMGRTILLAFPVIIPIAMQGLEDLLKRANLLNVPNAPGGVSAAG